MNRLVFKRILRWLLIAAAAGTLLVAAANLYIIAANASRLYDDPARLPGRDIGLVLGTSRTLPGGRPNLHFTHRIAAAAQLFRAGKVRHLLVSGDHRHASYDEPAMMQAALVAAGVPAAAITRDDAGFRTLDSVVRARDVFGVTSCVIITQRFHNSRALELARAHGLDAVGYCAADPPFADLLKSQLREVLARVAAVLDLYVWHRHPSRLGGHKPIRLGPP
jgi:SanA protein